jgi:hypothetical protein
MKALRFHAARDLRLEDIQAPQTLVPARFWFATAMSAFAAQTFTNMHPVRSSSPATSRILSPRHAGRRSWAMNSAVRSRPSAKV